ncbi:2-oxoglutarate dehydrogenase E1 component, partial [Sphingomonas sp.]|uniref:2-oxoglutarate dehydrogenase E1 component n=1 Tax=Sphingomonas sp. TaxID=28214 RepID=UPI0025F2E7B9
RNRSPLDPEETLRVLTRLTDAEIFEQFVHTNFLGAKRFSAEGAESMIAMLDLLIDHAAGHGIEEIVIGMAHRGRLNVLANVMGKNVREIFAAFRDSNPERNLGRGDVKYHLGASAGRITSTGRKIHLSLAFNPSHLEFVNPVVEGRVRAKQDRRARLGIMPLLIHGDAAFMGQGIIAETLNMAGLEGYSTGGTIHLVVNNQIGFTTVPSDSRSTRYCTDISRMLNVPVFHVNGEDPEAVIQVTRLAIEFRQRFNRDIVIDMWCYRRFGHNEGDEPSFTQPLMYAAIKTHPPISEIYAKRLVAEGVIDQAWLDEKTKQFVTLLEGEFQAALSFKPNKADWFEGRWSGFGRPDEPVLGRRNTATAIPDDLFGEVGETLTTIPAELTVHKTLARILDAKKAMFANGEAFDWATGEALAFGSLVAEGHNVRLSGQDSGRGTFSQRHAVWVDQVNGEKYIPLRTVQGGRFEVRDSPLSEFGVLGFEYGYSIADPRTLVLWEAQFGDFANGAQTIMDQFIASGESKWLRASGLVLLLPHGFEGQGPEHSSARLERYLQLCADDNIQVVNCTTPANYFHVLRRQLLRDFRKPLIMMTPKSLLRHKLAVSTRADFTGESHFKRILSDLNPPAAGKTRRLVLCSGKVAFELLEARNAAGASDTEIIRVEQIYPFPSEPLVKRLKAMPNLTELVWAQEEPKNNGAWHFVESCLEECLANSGHTGMRPRYAGRAASASPATGLAKRHAAEQAALIADALGHNVIPAAAAAE